MPYNYSEVMDSIKKHFIKAIYATDPSWSSFSIPSWKKYSGETLSSEKGNITRLFDVEESETPPIPIFTGNGADDFEATINIEVCYENNNRFNSIANGDSLQIRHKLLNLDNTDISAMGFNFLIVEESEFPEPTNDEEYRILTIPVTCRVTISNITDIPFEGVYKDFVGDSDVYKDSVGNFEVYKDVI